MLHCETTTYAVTVKFLRITAQQLQLQHFQFKCVCLRKSIDERACISENNIYYNGDTIIIQIIFLDATPDSKGIKVNWFYNALSQKPETNHMLSFQL